MVKVKLISRYAGPDGNFSPGSVLDFENDTAKALVEGGYAEFMEIIPAAKEQSAPKAEVAPKKTAPKKTAPKKAVK